MKKQNQIKRTLTKPESIEKIKNMLDTGGSINRTALADKLCSHFNFYDPGGNKQRSSCLKALRNLEKAGHFTLPRPTMKKMSPKKPRRPKQSVPEPKNVPASAGGIDKLKLVIVKTREEMQIWNELMIKSGRKICIIL